MTDNTSKAQEKVHKILIVDDEPEVLKSLSMTLKLAKQFVSDITTCEDPVKALDLIKANDFDLVISDFRMPNVSGVELLTEVKKKDPRTGRILITGYSDVKVAMDAINKAEVHNYLEKPWDNEEIRSLVFAALSRKAEREASGPKTIDNVKDAIQYLQNFQDRISKTDKETTSYRADTDKFDVFQDNKLIFEFPSVTEFNKFSFELKTFKNVHIEDTYIFENKYVIKLFVDPKSVMRIR